MALVPLGPPVLWRDLRRFTARLMLTKAECRILFADPPMAEAMLASARDSFRQADDPLVEVCRQLVGRKAADVQCAVDAAGAQQGQPRAGGRPVTART